MNDNYYDNYSPINGPYSLHPHRNFNRKRSHKKTYQIPKKNIKMTIIPKKKYSKLSKKFNTPKVFFSSSSFVSSNINGKKNFTIEKVVRNNKKGKYYKNKNGKITRKNMVYKKPFKMTSNVGMRPSIFNRMFPLINYI